MTFFNVFACFVTRAWYSRSIDDFLTQKRNSSPPYKNKRSTWLIPMSTTELERRIYLASLLVTTVNGNPQLTFTLVPIKENYTHSLCFFQSLLS